MTEGTRLSVDDWVNAALEALLADGPDAVAVQPLARTLGATKGSFYWHFSGRDDLLRAALQKWLRLSTDDVIAEVEASSDDPRTKARTLLSRVSASGAQYPGQLQMYAMIDNPIVTDFLTQVTRRRIDYVASLLRAAGISRAAATRRATIAYSIYLGQAQLVHATPDVLPATAAGRRAILKEATALLLD